MATSQNLLFLAHRVPYPPDKGEKIRTWHVLLHLAKSHRVHLGCLADEPIEQIQLAELKRVCASVGCFRVSGNLQKLRALARMRSGRPLTVDVFYSDALRNWTDCTLKRERIQRIFAVCSSMAGYVIDQKECLRILDMIDVDSEKWRAYAQTRRWPVRAIYRREADALLGFERQLVHQFDKTLFASQAEAKDFARLAPEVLDRIEWLSNGVDAEMFAPELRFMSPYVKSSCNLVFTGVMNYWPNVDAVVWFVHSVLPMVAREFPEVQFHIVGSSPTRAVLRLARYPNVSITNRVSDV